MSSSLASVRSPVSDAAGRIFGTGFFAEKTGISRISSFDASVFSVRCAGEIRDWNPEEFFSPHRLKRLDRYAQFSVASAKLALDDAGIEYSRENPQDRIGVSFGTALGGVCKAEEQYIRFLKKGPRGVQPTLAVQVFGGSAHSNIAIEFGFRGVGTTNSNSCASGRVSVGEALRYIRDDFADVDCRRRRGSASNDNHHRRVRHHQDDEPVNGDPAMASRPFDRIARRICHGRRRGIAHPRRIGTCACVVARTFTPKCSATV